MTILDNIIPSYFSTVLLNKCYSQNGLSFYWSSCVIFVQLDLWKLLMSCSHSKAMNERE